jgi:hypothetical protein
MVYFLSDPSMSGNVKKLREREKEKKRGIRGVVYLEGNRVLEISL